MHAYISHTFLGHFPPLLPYLLYLFPCLFRRNAYILIKILQALMPADLHDQLRWCTCQELIGAE